MRIGYSRVSTDAQELAAQLAALQAAGCERIYQEKVSGVAMRPELAKLIARLGGEDTVIVTHLDRISRSTVDLLAKLDAIAKAGAKFKSLGEPWADTTTPLGNLVTTIMAGFAQFNREMILRRTAEGRRFAMANGTRFGRPSALTPHQRAEAIVRRANGESLSSIAASFNVSHSTVSRASRGNGE